MTETPRLIPEWAFPSYVFVPGENPHPKKSGGHMENEKDPIAPPIDLLAPEKSDHLRYALDLYNHGYFWESHVFFEALWNAHGRIGPVADFLKALIKLGAAGVKISIGQKKEAQDHFERADELLTMVLNSEGRDFLGIDLIDLKEQVGRGHLIIVRPKWGL